ncbi:MAG: DNA translocase FtsK, partial [Saprospiraceae bacterium]|nr:DNA translocase FtsK [Saprospiraceae bacterium]
MAAKKKKKKGQLTLGIGLNDERVPKLVGILLLFFALYLFIAFTSYLFTWQEDQNRVLQFSVELLLQSDVEMANWLGRLGAIISNMFFYWGFGLPSFIFVFLLVVYGQALIRRVPLKTNLKTLRYSVLGLIFFSVLLEFILPGAAFPWGGAFGEALCDWLLSFVGTLGMVVLLLFVVIGAIVWNFNPNFNEMTPKTAVTDAQEYLNDLVSGRLQQRQKRTSGATSSTSTGKETATLKPGSQQEVAEDIDKKVVDDEALDQALEGAKLTKGEQLQFELDKQKKEKQKSLSPTDAPLEIEESASPAADEDPGPAASPTQVRPLSVQEANKEHVEPYDPTLELSSYEHPVLPLLIDYSDQKVEIDRSELESNKDQIIETLLNYKIEIIKIRATIGPTITLYEIVPAPGVRISKIKNLEDDIALSLAALGIRIIAPIPGKGTVGIEVPNKKPQIVSMREVLMSDKFKRAKMDLPIALGKTISNEVFVADLAKMPHLLVAGATGQGKSVGINAILMSLLYKKHPSQVKLVLIDPKKVELFPYSKLDSHFLAFLPGQDEPITTETNKVVHVLNSLCIEMDNRYNLLKKASARNIREYNQKFVQRRLNPNKGHRFMPFIVLVVDEFADLIMTAGKEVELPIGRLAQLARAVGIHLIIATQRPSVNIITGVIKANFPARIAYKVTAKVDSRTI